MGRRGRAAALAVGLATVVSACELLPELATPRAPAADASAACLTLNEVLLTRQTVVRGVEDALEGRETEALLAASHARAELAVAVGDLHVEAGPEDLRAFVEEVAGLVAREADVIDLGRVVPPTRARLMGEGRSTLEALDTTLRLGLGEGSIAARACPNEEFFLPAFEFPTGG